MNTIRKNEITFFIGFLGYPALEYIFRGYTHWTMALTGGFCFALLCFVDEKLPQLALWKKCLFGALIISGAEFVVGCIVNLWLGWNVWDYSGFRLQLYGQVCLVFSVLWFLLCGPLFYFSRFLRTHFPDKGGSLHRPVKH